MSAEHDQEEKKGADRGLLAYRCPVPILLDMTAGTTPETRAQVSNSLGRKQNCST